MMEVTKKKRIRRTKAEMAIVKAEQSKKTSDEHPEKQQGKKQSPAEPRLLWKQAETLALIELWTELRRLHQVHEEHNIGFIPFSRFLDQEWPKLLPSYKSLQSISFDSQSRRILALTHKYKVLYY
jgi:hypothetical protein